MIQTFTRLDVIDNTRAKIAMCIGIPGGTGRKYASIGDIITVVIKNAIPKAQIQKSTVQKAVITCTKKEYRRKDGSYIRFDRNECVLINKDLETLGTRVFGPVARELRDKNFMKIISLAPEVV